MLAYANHWISACLSVLAWMVLVVVLLAFLKWLCDMAEWIAGKGWRDDA
jgi:hypothetical protein